MILSSVNPVLLEKWVKAAAATNQRITLHVLSNGWEFRCEGMRAFHMEYLPKEWCAACDGIGDVAGRTCSVCGGSGRR